MREFISQLEGLGVEGGNHKDCPFRTFFVRELGRQLVRVASASAHANSNASAAASPIGVSSALPGSGRCGLLFAASFSFNISTLILS